MKEMIAIKDILFIINPHSGKQNPDKIIKALLNYDPQIQYFISNSKDEFDDFMSNAIQDYKVLVICGGDGTLNNVLKYTIDNDNIILAILPSGSGDGFAKEIGFKKDLNILMSQIELGQTQLIDLVSVNKVFSCNMIGLGIDSKVADDFKNLKRRGLLSYIVLTIKAYFNYTPIMAEIKFDDSKISGFYQMINVANTRQFGNNVYIAPQAIFDDGILEVVLVKPLPFYYIPVFIYRILTCTLKASKYIEFVKTSRLTITSDSKTYHVDGEPLPMPDSLNISINRKFKIISTQKFK
ncbi:diacylglycerol/lipid kinase family protein [Fulvivirga lutimaris]|uniref:diacylglycerol/lipid kinase family protein n=1 Tax=Fulvivirga lutimaris TaxID=1819566 RepID=UPI0012BB688C|nr:diacylglycerol kinase family protein [Fulvivirga lutimaris]MTI40572.1 diacylglycerol kinase [Fulvivirga lutimaris]